MPLLMVVAVLLTGTICVDGSCRELKNVRSFGTVHSCQAAAETIVELFRQTPSEELGYAPSAKVHVELTCTAVKREGLL
jgi:hypothetical protein